MPNVYQFCANTRSKKWRHRIALVLACKKSPFCINHVIWVGSFFTLKVWKALPTNVRYGLALKHIRYGLALENIKYRLALKNGCDRRSRCHKV